MKSLNCPQCSFTNSVTATECQSCHSSLLIDSTEKKLFDNVNDQQFVNQQFSGQFVYQGMPPIELKRGLAIASMVLGIISLVLAVLAVGVLLAPMSLILGTIALVKSLRKPQIYGGRRYATIGIVLSSVILVIFGIIFNSFTKADKYLNELCVISNVRVINNGEDLLKTSYPQKKCGDLSTLAAEKLIDSKVGAGERCGYRFNISVSPADNICEVQATPIDSWKGTRSFYLSSEDGIIRGADKNGVPADKNDAPINEEMR